MSHRGVATQTVLRQSALGTVVLESANDPKPEDPTDEEIEVEAEPEPEEDEKAKTKLRAG